MKAFTLAVVGVGILIVLVGIWLISGSSISSSVQTTLVVTVSDAWNADAVWTESEDGVRVPHFPELDAHLNSEAAVFRLRDSLSCYGATRNWTKDTCHFTATTPAAGGPLSVICDVPCPGKRVVTPVVAYSYVEQNECARMEEDLARAIRDEVETQYLTRDNRDNR